MLKSFYKSLAQASMEETESSIVNNTEEDIAAVDKAKEKKEEVEEKKETEEAVEDAAEENKEDKADKKEEEDKKSDTTPVTDAEKEKKEKADAEAAKAEKAKEKKENDKDLEASTEGLVECLNSLGDYRLFSTGMEEFADSLNSLSEIRTDIVEDAIPNGGLTRAEAHAVNAAVQVETAPFTGDESVNLINPDDVGGKVSRLEATETAVKVLDDFTAKTSEAIGVTVDSYFARLQDKCKAKLQMLTDNRYGSKLDLTDIRLDAMTDLPAGVTLPVIDGYNDLRSVLDKSVAAIRIQLTIETELQAIASSDQTDDIIADEYVSRLRRAVDAITELPLPELEKTTVVVTQGPVADLSAAKEYVANTKTALADLNAMVTSGDLASVVNADYGFLNRLGVVKGNVLTAAVGLSTARANYITGCMLAATVALEALVDAICTQTCSVFAITTVTESDDGDHEFR